MPQQGLPVSGWQRNVIGVSAVVLMIAAAALYVTDPGWLTDSDLPMQFVKMSILLGVVWLAWPQAFRPTSLLFLGAVLATLIVVTRFPKVIPFLIVAIVAIAILRPRLAKIR